MSMPLRLVPAGLTAALLLSACASTPPPLVQAGVGPSAGASDYGLFLAGRAALADGRSQEASQYFAAATGEGDGASYIGEQAFTAALLSGDVKRAAALAPTDEQAGAGAYRFGRLALAVDLMASGKGKEAYALLGGDGIGYPHRGASALLAPWAAAEAGETAASLAAPAQRGDRVVAVFGRLSQAQLYERARQYTEADQAFKALIADSAAGALFVSDYGEFLERRGRRTEAVALYDEALAEHPQDADLLAARARAAGRKPAPPMPTLREGAAQGLLASAATLMVEGQNAYALGYLRLALHLDPKRDEAWLMAGDLLSRNGDGEGARAAYAKVSPGSAQYSAARSKIAWSLQASGDKDGALKLAQEASAAAPKDDTLAVTYADLLRANERYEESVAVMDGVIARASEPDWRYFYMRGVALERVGRWPDAERDLQAALKLQPDEPELLNYLGYSWIDKGEHLEEALAMVQKAVDANPRSGAMIDSLGWAHYRLGHYDKAVGLLEKAVELEPADVEVNGHLGDAYWRVGRRTEAQFQWRRVLSLEPDEKTKALTEAKLEHGLGASPAPAKEAATADAARP